MAPKGAPLSEVCEALDAIAPLRLACDWDNVGLLAGNLAARVSRVILCIDLMPAVVSEALRDRANLVVSYHPPIFRPIARIVAPSDRMEAQVLRCLERGVAVYSPHTAFDAARGGTNDVLADLCGVVDPWPVESGDAPDVGMGRVGSLAKPIVLGDLTRKLKRRTGAACVSVVGDPQRIVRRAIVGVGAAGDIPFSMRLRKDDVIVTGEMRHHDALRVLRLGCSAIALSHWSSERPALQVMARALQGALPALQARVSEADREPFMRA